MIASLGIKWLQKTKVSHCKKTCWFISVTAKKRKRITEPVSVIATNLREWLQLGIMCVCKKKKPDFVCVVEKRNLVVWNMIASLGSKWLQKTKVCHCKKTAGYFCDCKKRKIKLNQCVIATNLRDWLQLGIMCVLQKKGTWLCLCGWKKKLGCLEYDCKPG
jgi:hypothetical protein